MSVPPVEQQMIHSCSAPWWTCISGRGCACALKNCVGVRGWDCRAMSSARRIPEQEAQDSAARCNREREREREPHIPFNNVGAQWVVGWLVGWLGGGWSPWAAFHWLRIQTQFQLVALRQVTVRRSVLFEACRGSVACHGKSLSPSASGKVLFGQCKGVWKLIKRKLPKLWTYWNNFLDYKPIDWQTEKSSKLPS